MGKLRNFFSHITVHKKDKDSFIKNEVANMGPGKIPKAVKEKKNEPKRTRK